MFEVGFTEIILILGIALVVLGPEKLPKVARDVGRWLGRARSMARQLKSQLDEEVLKEDRWGRPNPGHSSSGASRPGATRRSPEPPPQAPGDEAAARSTEPAGSAAAPAEAQEPSQPGETGSEPADRRGPASGDAAAPAPAHADKAAP